MLWWFWSVTCLLKVGPFGQLQGSFQHSWVQFHERKLTLRTHYRLGDMELHTKVFLYIYIKKAPPPKKKHYIKIIYSLTNTWYILSLQYHENWSRSFTSNPKVSRYAWTFAREVMSVNCCSVIRPLLVVSIAAKSASSLLTYLAQVHVWFRHMTFITPELCSDPWRISLTRYTLRRFFFSTTAKSASLCAASRVSSGQPMDVACRPRWNLVPSTCSNCLNW